MKQTQVKHRRARFTRGVASDSAEAQDERRRGRWTGYYPLSAAVAEARLNSLQEQDDKQPKEER